MGIFSKNSRKYKRDEPALIIKYRTPPGEGEFQLLNLIDMSAGGLRFLTTREFKLGSAIEIRVMIPWVEKPLDLYGEVLRVMKHKRYKNGFSVAIQYTKIASDQQKMIDNFISQSSDKNKGFKFPIISDIVIRKNKS